MRRREVGSSKAMAQGADEEYDASCDVRRTLGLRRSRLIAMASALKIFVIAALLCACRDAHEEPKVEKDIELTPAMLASIPDDAVEHAVIDCVISKIGADLEHAPQIVAKLPIGAQALYITGLVEAEVNAGGFDRYYRNTNARFADQAAEAFEFFSAHEHAALMREASSVHAMDAQRPKGSQLGPLDDRFHALKEDLSALRIAKIRSMPELFSKK
jgi:hypothetical protein